MVPGHHLGRALQKQSDSACLLESALANQTLVNNHSYNSIMLHTDK